MDVGTAFKVPSIIPQDLQLIQDIVGDVPIPSTSKAPALPSEVQIHEAVDDSDSDADSEQEVEAGILAGVDEDEAEEPSGPTSSESMSDSDSSSDSDSDESSSGKRRTAAKTPADEGDLDDTDETGPSVTSAAQVRTKNEIEEADIAIPAIEEVGPHEVLEKVGEVMSIVDKVVIIKGFASEVAARASERALDSDTLLVFEDRKVLGYVYETFGPTTQPLYQVKFNDKYPIDEEKVKVSRPVFHVPERSNFVFVRALRHLKGSDASNINDEEPAEEEMEYSDDEAEAAAKRARTQRHRSRSAASSRHTTPIPSMRRDSDMSEDDAYGVNHHGQRDPYNDLDYGAGPSRPAPMPYDDPYADNYGVPDSVPSAPQGPPSTSQDQGDNRSESGDYNVGRGRGRGHFNASGRGRRDDHGRGGRGRGRGRGRERGRGRGRGRDDRQSWGGGDRGSKVHSSPHADYDSQPRRSMSPTSLAIARATGQYSDGSVATQAAQPYSDVYQHMNDGGWGDQYAQQQQQQQFNFPGYGYQNQYVQPHINPRFASTFAMNFGFAQANQYTPYGNAGYSAAGDESGAWNQSWGSSADGDAGSSDRDSRS